MDGILRDKLAQLTNKCQILARNSKYSQCIQISQQIVSIKKQLYGMQHQQFQKSSQKLCQFLNLGAMVELQQEKFELSLEHLKKAELVAKNSLQFKSTTYNNLACYYRRTGKIRTALAYLISALELELKMETPKTLADTHLNLCAVLSQLDRHQDALQHIMLSIILIQDEFLQTLLPRGKQQQLINDERMAVLTIAYHNLGVQFQHLKRFQQSLKIYKKALSISTQYLNNNQQLIENLTKVVKSATSQLQDTTRKSQSRKKKERQLSENKKEIYRDFDKQVDKIKNLPKLRKQPQAVQAIVSQQPIGRRDKSFSHQQQFFNQNINQSQQGISLERGFVTRKRPRYYRSYGMTPSDNGSSLPQPSQVESILQTRIPVSEALQDFSG